MDSPKSQLEPKRRLGLILQLIGIALLIWNLYSRAKHGVSHNYLIPIGLALTIGGMFLVISKRPSA